MKKILLSFILITAISCSSDSPNKVNTQSQPENFSSAKYNEDLIGNFYLPEMDNVLNSLSKIDSATSNCENFEVNDEIKNAWLSLSTSYQKIWPLTHATLDRDPEIGAEISQELISVAYPYDSCRVQKNTSIGEFSRMSLKEDSSINVLEMMIFKNITTDNLCSNHSIESENINTWIASGTQQESLCQAINIIAKHTHNKLKTIQDENKSLYAQNKSGEILSSENVQKTYDSIALFVDQELKDSKVATPLGVTNCLGFTCPTATENQPSNTAFKSISSNLQGLMMVFNQNTSMTTPALRKGLYQFLLINDHAAVANQIYLKIQEAYTLSEQLSEENFLSIAESIDNAEGKSLCELSTTETPSIPACVLYKSIKDLSDLIKVDLRLALSLSKSKQIEGDSD